MGALASTEEATEATAPFFAISSAVFGRAFLLFYKPDI
jgi:hypothetical protein